MKRIIKRTIVLALCVFMLFTNVSAIELTGRQEYVFIHDLVEYIQENAKFPEAEDVLLDRALYARLITPEKGFNGMVEAVMSSLDEHSGYLTEETYNSFMESTVAGSFVGIGVNISVTVDGFVIISAVPDSPAEKVGIRGGDILAAVDGENVEGQEFQAVRSKITGEINTPVQITVRRGEELISFTVLRGNVKAETTAHEIIDGIGYLRIMSFSATTPEGVREALSYFDYHGIDDVVIDLRDNPGGELNSVLEICRMFTPKGVIMRVEYAEGKEDEIYYNETDNKGKYNLAVLVNGGSASASELFAGAIMDTASGVLIGTQTFGKGTVQSLMPIVSGGGIRLTIAEYKTAGGRAIHHVGLTPDIYVRNKSVTVDTSYMAPMELGTTWKAGDAGEGVLAVEQRLEFWGYLEGADTAFDEETAAALRLFQVQNELTVTGTADIYTQIRLHDADYTEPVEQDLQLDRALEYLKR